MFYEGDEVEVTKLDIEVQEVLADALETDFEEIEFYFVEYEDDDYVVLSAETDRKFAIIHCPVEALEGHHNDEEEVERLFDHIIGTHLLDRALETKNEELFNLVCEYRKQPREMKEKGPQNIYMNVLYDEDIEELDDDFFFDGEECTKDGE